MPVAKPPIERCWKFILYDETTSCWLWTGNMKSGKNGGYAHIWDNRTVLLAHKVIWEHVFGPVPEGKELHHRCETRRCVNPFHLECLMVLEHQTRHPKALCSVNRLKTHCNKGHPLSGDNLHIEPGGGRRCITCRREKERRWYGKHGKEFYNKHREKELKQKRDKYWSDPVHRQKLIDKATKDSKRRRDRLKASKE